MMGETTTMETAFSKAGYRSAEKRLRDLADDAIELTRGPDGKPSFTEALRCLDESIGDDGRLLREAVGQVRLQAALSEILGAAAARARGEVPVSAYKRSRPGRAKQNGSHVADDAHSTVAPEREEGGQKRRSGDTHSLRAAPSRDSHEKRVRHQLANSYLDTVRVGALPMRLASIGAVRASAEDDLKTAWFKRLILSGCEGLPDTAIIGHYIDDETAAKAWGLAVEKAKEVA